MQIKDITDQDRIAFNKVVNHPLQSFEWGEFRKKTSVKVIRKGVFDKNQLVNGFQLTIHKIPYLPWTIGYLPKGPIPTKELIDELLKIGKEENCVFIQLEPNALALTSEVTDSSSEALAKLEWAPRRCVPSAHPLFSKYTFILDLTKSGDELLKNMHPKTRYNIKIAQKHNVKIVEDNSDEAFNEYLKLTEGTTKRQGFFAHTVDYHKKMWETIRKQNELQAHLFLAKYNPPSSVSSAIRPQSSVIHPLILTAWILFVFKDIIYYPYGASSRLYRNVMAPNLIMWEAIKFGKKLGLKKFDMWGALGPNPNQKDAWFGFHRFKQGYCPELTEFVGSYDLIINPVLYQIYKISDKIRWVMLRLKK